MSLIEKRIALLKDIESKIVESIATIHHWNIIRPDCDEPLDVGFERVMLSYVQREIAACEQGDIESAKQWHKNAVEWALGKERECLE